MSISKNDTISFPCSKYRTVHKISEVTVMFSNYTVTVPRLSFVRPGDNDL